MENEPTGVANHRVSVADVGGACKGVVRYAPAKSTWFMGMALAAVLGGAANMTPGALVLFLVTTATVLLFGHSLGSHRKLIHNSYA